MRDDADQQDFRIGTLVCNHSKSLKLLPEPRPCKVEEGPELERHQVLTCVQKMNGPGRGFECFEHHFKRSIADGLRYLIGQQSRETAPLDSGVEGGLGGCDEQTRADQDLGLQFATAKSPNLR